MGSDNSDLLIFTERGYESPKLKEVKPAPKTKQKTAPKQEEKPAQQPRPSQPTFAPSRPSPAKQAMGSPIEQEPAPSIEDKVCINHPWRKAFAFCDKDKLPYCYVDLIAFNGKYYCLQDIDSATRQENKEKVPAGYNTFNLLASVFILVNSFLLFYFTYPQVTFLVSAASAHSSKIASFFLNLNPQYVIPLANTLIIFLGVIASLTIITKSNYGFMFSFLFSFGAIFVITYEYLNSDVVYLLASGALLLFAISLTTYSRMSSLSHRTEERYETLPEIEWPKPETF